MTDTTTPLSMRHDGATFYMSLNQYRLCAELTVNLHWSPDWSDPRHEESRIHSVTLERRIGEGETWRITRADCDDMAGATPAKMDRIFAPGLPETEMVGRWLDWVSLTAIKLAPIMPDPNGLMEITYPDRGAVAFRVRA
jgi:hypothetical protein